MESKSIRLLDEINSEECDASGKCTSTNIAYGFKDITSDTPFNEEISRAQGANIIGGYGDNTFRPNNSITRGEMAKIIDIAMSK